MKTLSSFLILISMAMATGCTAMEPKMPQAPAKPRLQTVKNDSGLVCFNREDAGALAQYIIELEHGYQQ